MYRILPPGHESNRMTSPRRFDIRSLLLLVLIMVCISCIYLIRSTDPGICETGLEGSVPKDSSPLEEPIAVSARPNEPKLISKDSFNDKDIYKRYILFTEKCHMPHYDHDDPVVNEKHFSEKPPGCSEDEKPGIFYPKLDLEGGFSCIGLDGFLYNKFYAKSFALKDCRYREAVRSVKHYKIDFYHELKEPKPLTVGSCPPEEFVLIECGQKKTKDYYAQPLYLSRVKPIPNVVRGNNLNQKPMHVLVLGVDSLSRLNAHRQLKKSLAFLQTKGNLVEFYGFNKIGINSASNQIPMLSGIPYKTPDQPGLAMRSAEGYFDNMTRLLWDDYMLRGYRSMFIEDAWMMGHFVYPPMNGFKEAPTTYWPRPLQQAAERAKNKKGSCFGPDQESKHLLDYTYNTFKVLGVERPLFAYVWLCRVSHEHLNAGQLEDQSILDFFTKMDDDKMFEDTAILFLADHGWRMGDFRNTPQGRFEDMLPFCFFHLPNRYFAAYPEARKRLEINSRRLMTPYDLHASLLDLADAWDEGRLIRTANGYSVFSSVIPSDRTCEDAGIDIEFCACYEPHPEDTRDAVAQSAASQLVDQLNAKLRYYNATDCSQYKLVRITEFIRLSEGASWTNYYKIVVALEPPALFEVTSELLATTLEWRVVSDFDRLDRYSPHSQCTQGEVFEKLCYCK